MNQVPSKRAAALVEESSTAEAPDSKDKLRLWLRLYSCATLMETELSRRLRERFDVTAPRFDMLEQLERTGTDMTLGELSRRLMVTNGNVTGLVERLVAEGLIARKQNPDDRRSSLVRLTEKGRRQFRKMAAENEHWVAELFAGLSKKDVDSLVGLLTRAKVSARSALAKKK